MKRFIISILVLIAVTAGVGLYRGWFIVDQPRIRQDEETVKEELREFGDKVKDETSKLTEKKTP